MPGFIVNGREEEVYMDGVHIPVVNYHDVEDLRLKSGEDMRSRNTRWIRMVMWHTTKVTWPETVLPGRGPDVGADLRVNRNWWKINGTAGGAHFTVDHDGSIAQHADLIVDAAYHGGSANDSSIGGEIYKDERGCIYQGQLRTCVLLTVWLCRRFGIQMQCPPSNERYLLERVVAGGRNCVGVFGHRHNKRGKAPGDPGDAIFDELIKAGFQPRNFSGKGWGVDGDRVRWQAIQRRLCLLEDGIPGPITRDALWEAGYPYGLWTPDGQKTTVSEQIGE